MHSLLAENRLSMNRICLNGLNAPPKDQRADTADNSDTRNDHLESGNLAALRPDRTVLKCWFRTRLKSKWREIEFNGKLLFLFGSHER